MAVQDEPAKADASRPIVMLDGAYIWSVPGRQIWTCETICGRVEQEGHSPQRFALVRSVAEPPHALLHSPRP